eukprot:NODE_1911_length_712_cov_236.693816_g1488_i0.p2 GENE.NODE_1911_length_712_cov_236.693816_g1488_i0~~NODE_1911_length_712_cov_236.693816_g1488_i0.p2  ORF type:complete len:211 (-),score=66.17 NODE_1911_length_712_cov_236.693816_g1488_i0:79-657(-)
MKSFGRLSRRSTAFFLCDIQEKFVPKIYAVDSVVWVANYLAKASQVLECPLIVTEQYPKGLGKTYDEIKLPEAARVFAKTKFSMVSPEVMNCLTESPERITDIVLFGIEAHVCIQQTAMDLLESGYNVHIAADGVSSQRQSDRMMALERLRQLGVYISTSESILFEILRDAKDPYFKGISELSKDARPDSRL